MEGQDALARQLVDEVYEVLGAVPGLKYSHHPEPSKGVQESPGRQQLLQVTSRPGRRGEGLKIFTLPWSS